MPYSLVKTWKVIGRFGKMCEITRESMRGGNNLHLDWLGQDVGPYASNSDLICKGRCEGILLKDLADWLAVKVCIDLENLQQRLERKQQSVEINIRGHLPK
jgi:hypothetical protein